MERIPLPRTLILDYYDSYTNNLVTLFTQIYSDAEVLERVVVVKHDRYTWNEFQSQVLPNIDCVILSPGPGRPDNPADIGFALELLRLHPLPILGVCLGHQAIGVAFGGKIMNTPTITHGHVIPIEPTIPHKGLFASRFWKVANKQVDVVVYNSLTVDPTTLPEELEVTAWSVATPERPATVQGLRHCVYPIWGIQYHPESISSTQGKSLLQSFLNEVKHHCGDPISYPPLLPTIISACAYRVIGSTSKSSSSSKMASRRIESAPSCLWLEEKEFAGVEKGMKTEVVFERLVHGQSKKGKEKAIGEIWFDGQSPTRPTTSSLATLEFVLTYSLTRRSVTLHRPTSSPSTLILPENTSFWDWFSAGQQDISNFFKKQPESRTGRWLGGWAGWFGYEMKEESLPGLKRRVGEGEEAIDACWGWTNKLLERTTDKRWIVRGIMGHGELLPGESDMVKWLQKQSVCFGSSQKDWEVYLQDVEKSLHYGAIPCAASSVPSFHPSETSKSYTQQIDACRHAIRQGESYELTLTTSFTSSDSVDPFSLYLHLRQSNPAYYSTYMHFPTLVTPSGVGLSVLSSSPERFLKINPQRMVEMMPIKGTRGRVKPGQCVCHDAGCRGKNPGSEECMEEAKREDARRGKELQADAKERAENLMIVDLIRSDLLSCCIPSSVTVPKLIHLESYGVHNLVTTVVGKLADNVGSVDAIKRCFPPGSMTGAPKLRSVQLLEEFEHHQKRGIYSGALGYISVDGVTDLSVVIRTIIIEGNRQSIGAGGAITWLSEKSKEWEEVLTKVQSVVGELDIVKQP
ncbi:hypothetical protein L204_102792 [Cryptococcus depauperatus]